MTSYSFIGIVGRENNLNACSIIKKCTCLPDLNTGTVASLDPNNQAFYPLDHEDDDRNDSRCYGSLQIRVK